MIKVKMKVYVSRVDVPMSLSHSEVLLPVDTAISVEIKTIPKNYGLITYSGQVITVS